MTSELAPETAAGIPVEFRDVSKRYGDHVVLDELSFAVSPGERVVLIGPSGSGKTTVLRCMMGFERTDSGLIQIGDAAVLPSGRGRAQQRRARAGLRAARNHVGMVFQQFNLFPHLTVMQNLTIGPRHNRQASSAEIERRARALLEDVGLASKAESYPGQLSGGQQQRVAIARALAMRPAVMLFDEVTSALDPETVGEVLGLIRRIAESSTMTMLLVTHEMAFAAQVADRVIFMEQGIVVEQGPPAQVFSSPQEERTRRFLRRLDDKGA
jgi:polar amino acid transport system ATP-binding protein